MIEKASERERTMRREKETNKHVQCARKKKCAAATAVAEEEEISVGARARPHRLYICYQRASNGKRGIGSRTEKENVGGISREIPLRINRHDDDAVTCVFLRFSLFFFFSFSSVLIDVRARARKRRTDGVSEYVHQYSIFSSVTLLID